MAFTDIAPPPAVNATFGTGISIGLRYTKGRGGLARLTLTAAAQEQMFGESVAGKKFSAQVGRGGDEGKLRLVYTPDGDLDAKESVKGSVFITMKAWDLLPKDARPSAGCTLIESPSNVEAILQLPSWCRPSGVDGKMAAEFVIKKAGSR